MAGTGSFIHYGGEMSHFLWVEDFGGTTPRDTTINIFGELLPHKDIPETKQEVKELLRKQGILVEFSFLGGLYFIRNQLSQVDYIILDIRLDVKSKSKDENQWLPKILQDFYGYEPNDDKTIDENSHLVANDKLFRVAGYQLYVELVMEHGFPKEHILFCSDHANEQEEHRNAFKQAKIEFPKLYSKDDKDEVQTWVREHRENPYSKLRRGIINGCQYIQSLLKDKTEAAIQFDEFMKADNERTITVPDMQDYLETLQNILPLRQPIHPQRLYKLFIRSLAHEWDAAYPDYLPKCYKDDKDCVKVRRVKSTFGWMMKHARNWAAHTTELDQLAEPEVAFLFMVAMRAMFKLSEFTEYYENMLLNLFDKTDSAIMKDEIGTTSMNTKLPLSRTYLEVKNHILQSKTEDALYFNIMLNNLINNQVKFDYVTGLFQMFWHGLSPARLFEGGTNIDRKQNVVFKYSFWLNDYGKEENGFLFELARSIYKRSFADNG
jgi:hypothetical protein